MSYAILYDKQYVKIGEQYIPMILSGDNNCWTVGPHAKRARDWNVFSHLLRPDHKFYASEQVLVSAILADIEKTLTEKSGYCKLDKREISRKEVADQFGYYTSLAIYGSGTRGLTAKQYQGFVISGIKNAMTIDQLDDIGINLNFYHYHFYKDTLTIPVPDEFYITTEKEFFVQLLLWNDWAIKCKEKNEAGEKRAVDFSLQFDLGEDLVSKRLKHFRSDRRKSHARPTSEIEVDHYFALKNGMGYLIRYTRYGYKYAYHVGYSNKRFQFEKDAERYVKTLEKKGKTDGWEIEKINKPAYFKVSTSGVVGIKKLT